MAHVYGKIKKSHWMNFPTVTLKIQTRKPYQTNYSFMWARKYEYKRNNNL